MEQDVAAPGPQSSTRRAVLVTAGAAAIAVFGGCATYDQNAPSGGAPGDPTSGGSGDPTSGGSGDPTSGGSGAPPRGGVAGAQAVAQTSDIPVGSGKILKDRAVVITQPQAGSFKAFSAICTHQGCQVGEVKDETINCPCHGSAFRVADGSVARGPASRALKAVDIVVDGTEIRLA
jgi:Rieske Fe-S protein